MKGIDRPTGVAKDQKQTPKSPYNTDITIYTMSGSDGPNLG